MSKSSKRQFLVTIDGFVGTWAGKTGGERTAEVARAYDGGNPEPDLITAPPQTGNITVTRTYDPDRDDAELHNAMRRVGALRATVAVQPLTPDYVATGKQVVYPRAVLVAVHPPEVDAASGDAAEWSMEWAVSRVG